MATVRTEPEQPSDNEPVNGISPREKEEGRHVSAEADGSIVEESKDSDVTSSAANENSAPHGADGSRRNKDASEVSTATACDLQSQNGELVSIEPGEDSEATSDHVHIENRGQETNEVKEDNPTEISNSKNTIRLIENVPEETLSHPLAAQGGKTEMDKSNRMAKDEHKTEEEDVSKNAETTTIKRRKSRLECKECGKKFTRRETYNLHRYSHMHQDEEASLLCKECGITFQHRSDLIKHRSMHKEDAKPKFISKVIRRRRSITNLDKIKGKFQCEHCGTCFTTMVRLTLHACKSKIEKPFRCPLCRKEFQYRMSINAHMQSHSLDSPYRCLECNKGFQCVETLHIHQRSHAALKPYECPDCNMVFRHRSVMEDHRRRHTEEKPHKCKQCKKNFKYSSLLQQHKYLHTGRRPYRCSYCGKQFAFAQNMRAHSRQHKRIPDSSESRIANHKVSFGGEGGKENANHNVEQQRNCPLCPQMFYKASDLRAHMLIHEAEYERMSNGKNFDMMYACRFCPLRFPTDYTLQSHIETHQTNVLGVNTSQDMNHAKEVPEKQTTLIKDDVEKLSEIGLKDQTDKKPFRCKDCGKCFRYRSVLELHMRVHNKGYQCTVCKKTFRFSSYLQQHSIIHTGKKPYKCPDCGKDFAFHHNMKTHQRLHQQKPFRCTQCRKGYSDEGQLQRHMLSHTGEKPYKCHLCVKSFSLAYLLRDHLNTHTGERPHRCLECHKSFPWLSSLLVHQKIHTRKRQGQGHGYPLSIHSSRGRVREFVSSGRRGRPRLVRDNTRAVSLRQDAVSGQFIQERLLLNVVPQQLRGFSERRERLRLGSQHFQAYKRSRAVHMQQEWPLQISLPQELLHSQKGLVETQPTDVKMQGQGCPVKMSTTQSDMERPSQLEVGTEASGSSQDPQKSQWSAPCNSTQVSNPEQLNKSTPCDKGTIDFDTPTSNESESTVTKEDSQNQKSPGRAKAALTEKGQTGGVVLPSVASSLPSTSPWRPKASFEMSTTASLQELPGNALENHQNLLIQHLQQQPSQQVQQLLQQQLHQPQLQQQTQLPPTWIGAGPSNQIVPMTIPYTTNRFPHRPPMWGFQSTAVVSQALLNGPLQQGQIRPPQHIALISGQQIPLNQPSSFISSPFPPSAINISAPHPMHSVASQLQGPLPQGIFFTSQGNINEMPLMPQVTNLPQLAQQTETHKISNKITFSPDPFFQCMICGCSLPGELELQMHYMQHAQQDV